MHKKVGAIVQGCLKVRGTKYLDNEIQAIRKVYPFARLIHGEDWEYCNDNWVPPQILVVFGDERHTFDGERGLNNFLNWLYTVPR